MKKRILKIVVGGLTTICLILSLCFINVNASDIDNNAYFYAPNEYFNNYPYVEDLDDLKGTIWHFNIDLYDILENIGEATISLRFLQNEDNNSIFDLPFFLQLRRDWIYEEVGYPYFNDPDYIKLNVAPLCNNSFGHGIIINTNQSGGKVYLNYFPYTFKTLTDSSQIYDNVDEVINDDFIIQSTCLTNEIDNYINTYLDIGFSSQENLNNIYVGSPELYLFFPDTDYIIEEFNNTNLSSYSFLNLLRKYSTRVVFPYELFEKTDISYTDGYTEGYDTGYDIGYIEGYDDAELNLTGSYRIPFFTGVLNAVTDVLNIEVFPNVKLSYFVFIPLVLGITGMIFWFWRKD